MKTPVLSSHISNSHERTLEKLRLGGIVAFPTDTVYGVGASACNTKAVQRLYVAKGRTHEKAIPVMIGRVSDVSKVAMDISTKAQQLMDMFWPGALTLVLRKLPTISTSVSSVSTIAVRVPDHVWLLSLLKDSGPLAVTSANRSGGNNPNSVSDVLEDLSDYLDLVIDGGDSGGGLPSTIVDCTVEPIRIIRNGAISRDSIYHVLDNPD